MSLDLAAVAAPVVATGQPTFTGYPATGATLPYVVVRPLLIDPDSFALNGDALSWDQQFVFYCAGASVEASYNLAIIVLRAVQGYRLGGTTLAASIGYVGGQVEGHYESTVTVQLNQGGI